MKTTLLTLLIALCCTVVNAQQPKYEWSMTAGNSQYDGASSTITDANGNVYVAGNFRGTMDIDPSAATYMLPFSTSGFGFGGNAFVAKYNADGKLIRAFTLGAGESASISQIALDHQNKLVVIGSFMHVVDFDPSGNTSSIDGSIGSGFVAKYDTAFNYVWSFHLGNGGDPLSMSNITIDASDNFYVTGYFNGTVDFDIGGGTDELTANDGGYFVAKFDSVAIYQWAFGLEGVEIANISADALGNFYITGLFEGNVDFDPDPWVQQNLSADDFFEIFVVKYTTDAHCVWANEFDGINNALGTDIKIQPSGDLYVTGMISGVIDFDPSPTGTAFVYTNGGYNTFLASYNVDGKYKWAFSLGQPTGFCLPEALSVDEYNNIYLTGRFQLTVDFDPSANTDTISSGDFGTLKMFVAKYSSKGKYIFAFAVEGDDQILPTSITVDANKNLIVCGQFNGNSDFDPSAGSTSSTSNGSSDVYIASYSQPLNAISEVTQDEDGIVLYPNPATDKVYIQSPVSNYRVTVMNALGTVVKQETATANKYQLVMSELPAGLYFIEINTGGKSRVRKLVKS